MSRNKQDGHLDDGYRVVGPNTADGALSMWYFPTLKDANQFAKQLAEESPRPFGVSNRLGIDHSGSVSVLKFIGRWRPRIQPVEYIKADDGIGKGGER